MKSRGVRIERSTCVSAAKLTTASQPVPARDDGSGVGDVADDELGVDALEVRRVARVRELVEHHDVVAGADEALDEMGADEARSTRDQDAHRGKCKGNVEVRKPLVRRLSWNHRWAMQRGQERIVELVRR